MVDLQELKRYSKYSYLMNRLSDMQGAAYYATAKGVLSQAESAIVNLEAEVESLRGQLEEAQKEYVSAAMACGGAVQELHELHSSRDADIERAIRLARRMDCGIYYGDDEVVSRVLAQVKEQKHG